MSAPTLLTYRDMIDHLGNWMGALPQEDEQNQSRQAIQDAYRELFLEHEWAYCSRQHRITLDAASTSSTVTYSTSNRQVTLASGSWPTWARYGRILFDGDDVVYKVAERGSPSIITLDVDFCPAANVAAGTGYKLYRNVYPLPSDFISMKRIFNERNTWSTTYVSPSDWLWGERVRERTGKPFRWTIMGAPDVYAQLALFVDGYPTVADTIDFIFQNRFRPMNYDGMEFFSSQAGSGNTLTAAAAAQATFTVAGFTLPSDIVGSVLRLGRADSTAPPGGIGSMDPYVDQRVIFSREDDTNATVGNNFTFGRQGDHFSISDPVDLPHYLIDVFKRGCERQLAILLANDKLPVAEALYDKALKQAKGRSNSLAPDLGSPLGWWEPDNGLIFPEWVTITTGYE
jgi:hypothetical protein